MDIFCPYLVIIRSPFPQGNCPETCSGTVITPFSCPHARRTPHIQRSEKSQKAPAPQSNAEALKLYGRTKNVDECMESSFRQENRGGHIGVGVLWDGIDALEGIALGSDITNHLIQHLDIVR